MFDLDIGEIAAGLGSRLFDLASSMEKITDIGELDLPITEFIAGLDQDSVLREAAISHCPIEGHNGHWEGDRGDSMWIPDRDAVPARYNPNALSWDRILDKYGIEGIEYRDGDPDFSPIAKGEVEIEDFTDDRPSNFAQADEALAAQKGCDPADVRRWREENNYTWHECRDCKTMQKVPGEVHNNMDHSGGISEYKNEAE